MGPSVLGFVGKVLIAIALVVFIAWQSKQAIKEYKEKKSGKSN